MIEYYILAKCVSLITPDRFLIYNLLERTVLKKLSYLKMKNIKKLFVYLQEIFFVNYLN